MIKNKSIFQVLKILKCTNSFKYIIIIVLLSFVYVLMEIYVAYRLTNIISDNHSGHLLKTIFLFGILNIIMLFFINTYITYCAFLVGNRITELIITDNMLNPTKFDQPVDLSRIKTLAYQESTFFTKNIVINLSKFLSSIVFCIIIFIVVLIVKPLWTLSIFLVPILLYPLIRYYQKLVINRSDANIKRFEIVNMLVDQGSFFGRYGKVAGFYKLLRNRLNYFARISTILFSINLLPKSCMDLLLFSAGTLFLLKTDNMSSESLGVSAGLAYIAYRSVPQIIIVGKALIEGLGSLSIVERIYDQMFSVTDLEVDANKSLMGDKLVPIEISWSASNPNAIYRFRVDKDLKVNKGSLCIQKQEFFFPKTGLCMLSAPSGAGKSTILKLIAGELIAQGVRLSKYENGEISLITRREVAYAAQVTSLIPYTVSDNIEMLVDKKVPLNRAMESILGGIDYVNEIQFDGLGLSGGQAKRVDLVRTLFSDRDLIVLDETIVGVEDELKKQIMLELIEISKYKLILLSTHDKSLLKYASYCFKLGNRAELKWK